MANTNTSVAYYNLAPQTVGSSTSETLLQWTNASTPALANGATLTLALDPSLTTGGEFDGRPFRVRLCGKLLAGSTGYACTLKLYYGTAISAANVINTSGAVTLTGAKSNFCLESELLWDSASGIIDGSYQASVDSTFVVPAKITATGNQITGVTSQNSLVFTPSVTWGTGSTVNAVTVTEFSIERI